MKKNTYIISGIELPLESLEGDAFFIAQKKMKAARLFIRDPKFRVFKRSIDARKKENIHFVWSVAVSGECPAGFASPDKSIYEIQSALPDFEYGRERLSARPVIVGSGPAGMFCALLLAERGYRPIVLERGGNIANRTAAVQRFYKEQQLDEDCNIQFGAGGAGTFSDGKLVTRINDITSGYVLERFVEFGAPSEIMYLAKPHIGTDYLRLVVENILSHIISLGGDIRYSSRFDGINLSSEKARSVSVFGSDVIECGVLVLATGHSSRDTYRMLMQKGFEVSPKPYSVGVRIEHLQSDIDTGLYGRFAGHSALGHAEYALSADTKNRGVYTFCMCPGGEVVPAASMAGGVVVNGMSHHARDGRNANSAVVVSVRREDYGDTAEGAIAFQESIERAAFAAGGGDYSAPMCTVGDFISGKVSHEPSRIIPTYMGGKCRPSLPSGYLPGFVCDSLASGILAFDKKIKGFAAFDAVLTGAETRTSAPVRIVRNDDGTASGFDNIYPCGEGAGYAGGISSAAIDGIRTAIKIMSHYAPIEK